MSETTERSPLAMIEAFEAAAVSTAQVARSLLTEHPELALASLAPLVRISSMASRSTSMRLKGAAADPDTVRAWAKALGVDVESQVEDGGGFPFEWAEVRTQIDGVHIEILGFRTLTEDEATAWRAERKQAAEESGTAGATGGDL